LPLPSRLNLAYDFQLSTGLLAPLQTLAAVMGLAGLTGLGFFLFRRDRLAAFAVFWFFGNLLVESTVIPLELIFEHRMYMPAMFIILAAAAWFHRLSGAKPHRARLALVIIAVLFSVFTWQRNSVWQNEISIWTDVVSKSPNLARAHGNLGKAYGSIGDHKKAEQFFRQALELDPLNGLSYISLGAALENQDRISEALAVYNKALADETLTMKSSNRAQLYRNLARLHLKMNNFKAAVRHGAQALQMDQLNYEVYILLGAAHFKGGNFAEAEKIILAGIKHFPEQGALYRQLGVVYENQNRLPEAVAVLEKALTTEDVDLARTYNTLGIVYWRLQKFQQSVTAARKAIAANPELSDAYLTLGITYEEMGQHNMALEQFREAWRKGLDIVSLYNDWAGNFMSMNKTDRAIFYLQEAVALEPERLESFINLEKAYRQKGMIKEAMAARNRADSLRLQRN
ncbi:MAG: tetratricopeptide repeat protein, partial [Desulfobulbales bacterium]|nr:tetratricopeptide repeat protein [Desulfobulbales bacterium]